MADQQGTLPTTQDPAAYVDALAKEQRRTEGRQLIELLRRVSGHDPVMWGPSIIGFGAYRTESASGRTGTWPLIGFSPRATKLSIYLAAEFDGRDELLARLGRHAVGAACLYVPRLDAVDLDVLEQLCTASLAHVRATHEEAPVPTPRAPAP